MESEKNYEQRIHLIEKMIEEINYQMTEILVNMAKLHDYLLEKEPKQLKLEL